MKNSLCRTTIMKAKLNIIHSCDVELEVNIESSIYAPRETAYVMPEMGSLLAMGRNMYLAEKEKSDWIRRYNSLLKGLNYWRSKALEK